MNVDVNRIFGLIIMLLYGSSIFRGISEGRVGVVWNDSADRSEHPFKFYFYFLISILLFLCGALVCFGRPLPFHIF